MAKKKANNEPRVYTKKISDFQTDPNNANLHTQRGRGLVEKSQRERGFARPGFATKDGVILGGNLSVIDVGAEVFGPDSEIIVIETDGNQPILHVRSDLESGSPEAIKLALEDNRTAEASLKWDIEVLQGIQDFNDDVELTELWMENELKQIGVQLEEPPEAPEPQTDRAEELREKWGVETGQLWRLGEHWLICGDCTDAAVIARVMGGKKARMAFADPPYGIGKEIINDNLKREDWVNFYRNFTDVMLSHCVDNAYVYVWGYFDTLSDYWQLVLKERGDCNFRNFIIWKKSFIQGQKALEFRQFPEHYAAALLFIFGQPFQNGPWSTSPNAEYYPEMFEPIRAYLDGERQKMGWDIPTVKAMVGHSDLSGDHWFGRSQWTMPTRKVYETLQKEAKTDAFRKEYDELRKEYDELRGHHDNSFGFTDLWEFDTITTAGMHPTEKALEAAERAVMTNSKDSEIVLDPFLGSGTTLIACERLNRKCRAVEISPAYCGVVLERFYEMTNIQPELIEPAP